MRIAGILPCSFVNGDGARYVVFVQGCKHHCKGCHNPETWNFDGGIEITAEEMRVIDSHFTVKYLPNGVKYYQWKGC